MSDARERGRKVEICLADERVGNFEKKENKHVAEVNLRITVEESISLFKLNSIGRELQETVWTWLK